MSFLRKWGSIASWAVIVMAAARLCSANDGDRSFDFTGYASMEGGQFVDYKYKSEDYSHKWLQSNILKLGVNATLNPRLNIRLLAGGDMTYNTIFPKTISDPDDFANTPIVGFFLDRAEMILHCSPDPKDSLLDIGIGLWDEKYNSEARNLGEYLFRTGAYPGYIYQQGFDKPYTNLAGIHIDNNLFGFWHNQALLTSETQLVPFNDFSFSVLTDFTLLQKVIDVGGGIQFFRCFSVDKSQTTPQEIIQNGGVDYGRAPNYYLTQIGVDVNNNPVYDTSFYTFAGTKLMAQFTFDPKPLLCSGLAKILGAEDLKIYSEAVILGLKNYPANVNPAAGFTLPINEFGFDHLMQKMPLMFGLNIPTLKFLEVLSGEFEYYGKNYVNAVPLPVGAKGEGSYYPVTTQPAFPENGSNEYTSSFYQDNRSAHWKWSLYAKKNLLGNFTITAQAARDHTINTVQGLSAVEVDREEALVRGNQWFWMFKFGANF